MSDLARAVVELHRNKQIGAGGVVRRYRATFDADFNRLSFVDPRDVIRQWAYDAAGRDTAETDDYSYNNRLRKKGFRGCPWFSTSKCRALGLP